MGRLVVAHEGLAFVFPDEDLEGKIECDERCGLHERSPGRGVAEDHELRVSEVLADASGLTAVIDDSEDLDSPGVEHSEQANVRPRMVQSARENKRQQEQQRGAPENSF